MPLLAITHAYRTSASQAEAHWAFRAVQNQSAVAALNRFRAAVTTSGLGLAKRKLIILRNPKWSSGTKTSEVLEEFARLGGRTLPIEHDDLAVFNALRDLRHTHGEAIIPWLRSKRPASVTKLFQAVFNGSAPEARPAARTCNDAKLANRSAPAAIRAEKEPSIPLGSTIESGQRVSLKLEDLRRHAAIFAGSGSGKTVLIRRIIEECALQSVSAIVLDPNNDLSRLGTPWPEEPTSWAEGDADKASRYFSETEVVIWTPRRATGRPLSFRPLADLSAVMADPDEFSIAIDNAVGTIFPRAGLPTTGGKAEQGRAVLNEALRQFALQGGDGLSKFLNFLSSLPEGVSRLANAEKLAIDMAQTLIAATVNDPLFGGEGEAVDPGVLLTPKTGKKARISVISLSGLPNDDQRQSFVNQLQMALFAWAKKNPAGDRPLGGLFVMDEAQTFAPSGSATPCTGSTLALASQARKYGLGLIFATQAPKGLHNRIPGNATTQFYGFLNAPAQITAAREMAAAKGADASDISRLTTGQFYIVSDCIALQKVSTPMCLSYHPKSPLTQQEILDLARDRHVLG